MSSKIVGVLLYPGCVYLEVARAVELLAERFQVLHFTPEGSVHAGADDVMIQPDGSYTALETTDVACVLVPGGNPDSIIPEQKATAALNRAAANGALMAGICAGNLVLASAGLLRGKRATHNYTAEYAPSEKVEATAPFWEGSVYDRMDVVEDGNLITAQPWASEQFARTIARRLGIIRSREPMEPHTLIVGGTGMLKQASIALAKRSRLLTSVARTAASLHKLDRELERGDGSHYMLQLDWSDGNFLDKLEAHCSAVGYPSLVVAWLHNDDLAPRIAARIGDAIESCRFFHVRSSAAADPNRGSERLAKAWAAVPVQQHEVILGFQITDSGSRWLDNSEISSGVITAIERGARKTVVGVVSPWANRP